MHIANDTCMATQHERWTYKNGLLRKQLDYFLVNNYLRGCLLYCRVFSALDTGSSHRAAELALTVLKRRPRRKCRILRLPRSCRTDVEQYRKHLALRLDTSIPIDESLTTRANVLEKHMIEAAPASSSNILVKHSGNTLLTSLSEPISDCIRKWRACGRDDEAGRRDVSKEIKKA